MVGNRMTSTYGYSNGYGEKARFNLGLPLSSIQLGAVMTDLICATDLAAGRTR